MKKTEKKQAKTEKNSCADIRCPVHGKLTVRGRTFEGYITKKFKTRIVVEFERPIYIKKYERYAKKKSKMHAHLPACLYEEIEEGDYVLIKECRPLSKIIHFVLIKKIRSK